MRHSFKGRKRSPSPDDDFAAVIDQLTAQTHSSGRSPGGRAYDLSLFPPVAPVELPDTAWARWCRSRVGAGN